MYQLFLCNPFPPPPSFPGWGNKDGYGLGGGVGGLVVLQVGGLWGGVPGGTLRKRKKNERTPWGPWITSTWP